MADTINTSAIRKKSIVKYASLLSLPIFLLASEINAETVNYTINSDFSGYQQTRTDSFDRPVVLTTQLSVSGDFTLDLSTGELISANLKLGSYAENFDFDGPFVNPSADFAEVVFSNEIQSIASDITATIDSNNPYQLVFSGENQWRSESVSGQVTCGSFGGVSGEALCTDLAMSDFAWGNFDITLDFSQDFQMVTNQTMSQWVDETGSHQLTLFASVTEVPVPGAAVFMLTGLAGLLSVQKNKRGERR